MQIRSGLTGHQCDIPAALADRPWRKQCLLLAISGFALLASGQALAQEAVPANATHADASAAEQAPRSEKKDKVCKSEDVIGSRMKKRVCYTPEEWEERERAAKELKREMDAKPVTKDVPGS